MMVKYMYLASFFHVFNPWGNFSGHMQSPGWQPTLRMARWLIWWFYKHNKSSMTCYDWHRMSILTHLFLCSLIHCYSRNDDGSDDPEEEEVKDSQEALRGKVDADYPLTNNIVRIFTSSTFTGGYTSKHPQQFHIHRWESIRSSPVPHSQVGMHQMIFASSTFTDGYSPDHL